VINPPYIRTRRDLFKLWRERLAAGEFA
jgi:hypothetical protein